MNRWWNRSTNTSLRRDRAKRTLIMWVSSFYALFPNLLNLDDCEHQKRWSTCVERQRRGELAFRTWENVSRWAISYRWLSKICVIHIMVQVDWGEVQLWAGEDEEAFLEADVDELHWKVHRRGNVLKLLGKQRSLHLGSKKKLFVQVLLPYRVCNLPERERAKRFWAELRSLAGHQVLDQFQRTPYTGISSFNHLSHFLSTSFHLMPNCTEDIIYVNLNYPERNLLWNFQGWDPWDHC